MKCCTFRSLALGGIILGSACQDALPVIFSATGDPSHNTTAPGVVFGLDATPAWNLQGSFNSFLGTPIAPNYFLTAKHIGGSVGDTISFGSGPNMGTFTTTAVFNDPNSDLSIWEVSTPFSQFASMYTGSSETGQNLIVFGRGTQRGAEYIGPGMPGTVRGWNWGTADGVQRWGTNSVQSIANLGAGIGQQLIADFDNLGSPSNESTLSSGDSGGAVFIQDGGEWKLAGINYAVSGSFYSNTGIAGSGVSSAIYDQNGLFISTDNVSFSSAGTGPGVFAATRISANQPWITSTIPEPSTYALVGASALAVSLMRFLRRRT